MVWGKVRYVGSTSYVADAGALSFLSPITSSGWRKMTTIKGLTLPVGLGAAKYCVVNRPESEGKSDSEVSAFVSHCQSSLASPFFAKTCPSRRPT